MIDLTKLSRAVSHALRHEPWLYELELDADGWAPLDVVVSSLRNECGEWNDLTKNDLAQMIAESAKRRHEIKGCGIRALYGHSVSGRLRKALAVPPPLLYHGTMPASVPSIKLSGLLPMGRQYVHLSVDSATAMEVGKRKAAKPAILRVSAADAHSKRIQFYQGNEKVWLADHVPAQFIIFENGWD